MGDPFLCGPRNCRCGMISFSLGIARIPWQSLGVFRVIHFFTWTQQRQTDARSN